MFRFALFVLLFIPVETVMACSCVELSANDRYMTSDFIGVVEIGRTYDVESSDERIYVAETKSIESYKGESPSKIFVSGTTEMAYDGQCEILVQPGERWLIHLKQDKNGDFTLSYCSIPVRISDRNGNPLTLSANVKRDIDQLAFLKNRVPGLHSEELIFTDSFELREFLHGLGDVSTDQEIATYLIDFNKDLKAQEVEILQGFSMELDKKITDYLINRADWFSGHIFEKSSHIDKPVQYVVSIFYDEETNRLTPVDVY
jgi:hypothetical protein